MVQDISVQDVALYDRQIRLWGMDAQARMRSAHVCIAGLNGLATEVIKNLVLAGIGKLTMLDDSHVSKDIGCQFFSRIEDVGFKLHNALPRMQALNPSVKLEIDTRNWKDLDPSYFEVFDILILCSGDQADLVFLSTSTIDQNEFNLFY